MRHLVQYKSIIFYGVAIILFDRKTIIFSVFLLCYVRIFFTYNYMFSKKKLISNIYIIILPTETKTKKEFWGMSGQHATPSYKLFSL